MAFGGYLIRVGNYELPLTVIREQGYSAKVSTLDEDSYTDNFGVLNRTVIQKIPQVQVELVEMDSDQFDGIMHNMRNNFSDQMERKAMVSVWVPEYGSYVSQNMYLSDMDIKIKEIKRKLVYESITLKFNGYGE